MSFTSWLQRIFNPSFISGGAADLEDDTSGFEWKQNLRIVLAQIVVFLSALVVWWIVS